MLTDRVAREQLPHVGRVSGENDDEIIAVVLGELHERVERLLAKRVAVVGDERVRLVDEEDAAKGRLDHLLRLDRRLPRIARHELRTVHLDQVANA